MARKFDATSFKIFHDSQLVVNQVNGTYAVKGLTMAVYLQKVKKLLVLFEKIELKLLPREKNSHADCFANIAPTIHSTGKRLIPLEYLEEKSIAHEVCASVLDEEETWVTNIVKYIINGVCPRDKYEIRMLRMRALKYCMLGGSYIEDHFLGC